MISLAFSAIVPAADIVKAVLSSGASTPDNKPTATIIDEWTEHCVHRQ